MSTAGLAVAITAGHATAAVPTSATVAHTATRTTGATAKHHANKARRKTSRVSTRAAARTARRATKSVRSARRRTHERSHERSYERARATEQSQADLTPDVSTVTLPAVALPELALAPADSAAPGARRNVFTIITRSASSLLDGLVSRARSQLGTRYVYGGANPGDALDCSSFARYVMEALNVRLPRTANQQAQIGRPVPRDPSQLRPGDLLTFGRGGHTSHVGIYLGEGRFIHASVKSGQVIETTIERNRSLFRRWQGARRLLAGAGADTSSTAGEASSGG